MTASLRLLMAIISALLAWVVYLQWFYDYAKNLSWFPYLMTLAVFSMFLMFLKNIRRGEIGHLEFFGEDKGIVCQQGWYWPPNVLPFLQGIHLTFGLDIVNERVSLLGSIAGNPNVHHYHEQRLPSYSVRVTSESFIRANLDRGMNLLFVSIFTLRDEEGRFKYYKLGTLLYIMSWVLAFIGNIGDHGTQLVNQAMGAAASVVNSQAQSHTVNPRLQYKEVKVSVQLDTGFAPVMPLQEDFIPTQESDVRYFFTVDGVKYFRYFKTSSQRKESIWIEESACALVPSGEEVRFVVNRAPIVAVNMERSVVYAERILPFRHPKFLDSIFTRPSRTTWEYLHKNWKYAETERHVLIARAQKTGDQPEPAGGGIVCF